MKNLLCIFGVTTIIVSASSSLSFGLKSNEVVSNKINNFELEKEPIIISKLTIFFEGSNNNLQQSRINNQDSSFVLDYMEYDYEEDLLFINFYRMLKSGVNTELISILDTEEFSRQLNLAFYQGMFVYEQNRVIYVPYEEELANIDLNFEETWGETTSNELQRNVFQRVQADIYTRWFWFGTYRAEFNSEATQILIVSLYTATIVSKILQKITKLIPKIGVIISQIFRILASYLKNMGTTFRLINQGNGVYFWATIIVVWYVRAL